MNVQQQIAKQFRDVHFGGNWTAVNLKDVVADVTWEEATTKVGSLNTIVTLVYHTAYYVGAVTQVLRGEPLTAKDKYSFDHPPIQSAEDWQILLQKTWTDAEEFARMIEKLPADKLGETFADEKYGSYYRNLTGIIEHMHYHLGQIAIIKKMIREKNTTEVQLDEGQFINS
ncbi:MAG TPA: DinB family protein [Flavobacteriales bacterium]|nr:DinB family protein [Flavobacteriales bacterium]